MTEDYSVVYLTKGKCDTIKVEVCCVVVEYIDAMTEEWVREYFDFLSIQKNDSAFTCFVWDLLDKEIGLFENFSEISAWSDGASKHYKNKYVKMHLNKLKTKHPNVKLTKNYFESYHGMNISDSHMGVAQQTKKRYEREFGLIQSMEKLKEVLEMKISDTCAPILASFKRSEVVDEETTNINGIKGFYHFEFLGNGKIKCWKDEESDSRTMEIEGELWD